MTGQQAQIPLLLREPLPGDEVSVRAAQAELAAEDFDFMLGKKGQSWSEYLRDTDRVRRGVGLAEGRVPATMLVAVVSEQIVGRVHMRHALTTSLLREGGHIGFAVRPAFRRLGYGSEMLRQGLEILSGLGVERALVTCDDVNRGSIGVIECNGGALENTVTLENGRCERRYWISTHRRD